MEGKERTRLVILVGPTAVGKTELALTLAQRLGGEIVSADSMQVYRHMDVGTAKPTPEQRRHVRHHLLDVVCPDEPFNAALFVAATDGVIRDLSRRRTPVLVVGGTGLYVRSLLGGLVAGPAGDEELRKAYRRILELQGREALYDELQRIDALAARRINPRDTVRMIRALEFMTLTGRSLMESHGEHGFSEHRYDVVKIGLTLDRPVLYDRIDRRIRSMLEAGWVEETRRLLALGYDESLKPLQSLGYKHIIGHLRGRLSLDEAVGLTVRDTRRYAKRQETWFRADLQIAWHAPGEYRAVEDRCRRFLEGA